MSQSQLAFSDEAVQTSSSPRAGTDYRETDSERLLTAALLGVASFAGMAVPRDSRGALERSSWKNQSVRVLICAVRTGSLEISADSVQTAGPRGAVRAGSRSAVWT